MSVGNNLKKIRQALNLTQEEFAKKLGLSTRILQEYEKDRIPLNSNLIIKLIELFKINTDWLFLGSGDIFIHESASKLNIQLLKGKYQFDNEKIEAVLTELISSSSFLDATFKLLEVRKNKSGSFDNINKILESISLVIEK